MVEQEKQQKQFKAHQSWKVKVLIAQAQSVMQAAIDAGANESTAPDWEVADRTSLQAKASGAALAKAKQLANEMASGLGARLGGLIYASNQAPSLNEFFSEGFWRRSMGGGGGGDASKLVPPPPPPPQLMLFAPKVKQDATVFAVFSIE